MASYKRYIDTRRDDSRKAPQAGVFISGYRDDYATESGRLGLNPARLGSAMRRADQGDHQAQQEIFSACLEDPHVHSVVQKRIRRVLSRRMQITPAIEDDKRSQDAADLVQQLVLGKDGIDGISNWRMALRDLGEAVFRGFALCQIVWTQDGAMWRPSLLQRWDQRDCLVGAAGSGEADQDADEVRVITSADRARGEPLEPSQWVLHVIKARSAPIVRAALGRCIVWWWLFKHFGAKDWMIFADRYGMPVRLGKYPRGSNDSERNALLDAVITLGKDAGAIVPDGTSIELVEARLSGESPYGKLIEVCDFQISKAVLGGTLTTDAGEKGARSLGEVHERNETDIAADDGAALCETLRRDLFAPIVRFNLGDAPVPYCDFPAEEQENLLERAKRDEILVALGLPIAKRTLYDVYGIEEPGPDDELLKAPTPPPFGMLGQRPGEQSPGDEQADEAELPEEKDVEAERLANRLGLSMRDVRALQDAKKKSRSWVTSASLSREA